MSIPFWDSFLGFLSERHSFDMVDMYLKEEEREACPHTQASHTELSEKHSFRAF